MRTLTFHENGEHRWHLFGHDADRPANVIDTNQYVVESEGRAALIDPGGLEIFPQVLAALSEHVAVEAVDHIVLSHQDPDVGSSLPLWREVCNPDMTVHVADVWTSFVSHFDNDARLTALPDSGGTVTVGSLALELVPAHFLHAPGNFCVLDARAGVLFTGDIAASVIPDDYDGFPWVRDFAAHTRFMEAWHRRAMGAERARDAWIALVRSLGVKIIAPQKGSLLAGENVDRFLDWFGRLEIGKGIDAIAEWQRAYQGRTARTG